MPDHIGLSGLVWVIWILILIVVASHLKVCAGNLEKESDIIRFSHWKSHPAIVWKMA